MLFYNVTKNFYSVNIFNESKLEGDCQHTGLLMLTDKYLNNVSKIQGIAERKITTSLSRCRRRVS